MKNTDDNMNPILDGTDITMAEEESLPLITAVVEKKQGLPRKIEAQASILRMIFAIYQEKMQLELAEKYWNGPVAQYDDGTFQFSYTHFGKVCEELGFKKGIVDTLSKIEVTDTREPVRIYIEHGTRKDVVEKKFSLNKETAEMIEELFFNISQRKVSNMEKSKIIDTIIKNCFEELLEEKKKGNLLVAYKPVEEIRII